MLTIYHTPIKENMFTNLNLIISSSALLLYLYLLLSNLSPLNVYPIQILYSQLIPLKTSHIYSSLLINLLNYSIHSLYYPLIKNHLLHIIFLTLSISTFILYPLLIIQISISSLKLYQASCQFNQIIPEIIYISHQKPCKIIIPPLSHDYYVPPVNNMHNLIVSMLYKKHSNIYISIYFSHDSFYHIQVPNSNPNILLPISNASLYL